MTNELIDLRDLTIKSFYKFNDLSKVSDYDSKSPRGTWLKQREIAWNDYVICRDELINQLNIFNANKKLRSN